MVYKVEGWSRVKLVGESWEIKEDLGREINFRYFCFFNWVFREYVWDFIREYYDLSFDRGEGGYFW